MRLVGNNGLIEYMQNGQDGEHVQTYSIPFMIVRKKLVKKIVETDLPTRHGEFRLHLY